MKYFSLIKYFSFIFFFIIFNSKFNEINKTETSESEMYNDEKTAEKKREISYEEKRRILIDNHNVIIYFNFNFI